MEYNFNQEFQEKMKALADQMSKVCNSFKDVKPVIIDSCGGCLDGFITAAKKHISNDVIIVRQKEYEKLRAEVEKCNNEYPLLPTRSLSELFEHLVIVKEYQKATPKTPEEIIQSKKNKKPFYKSLERLKKWEK